MRRRLPLILIGLSIACVPVEPDSDLFDPVPGYDGDHLAGRAAGEPPSPLPDAVQTVYIEPAPSFLNDRRWRQEVEAAFRAWEQVLDGARHYVVVGDRSVADVVVGFRDGEIQEAGACPTQVIDRELLAVTFAQDVPPCLRGRIYFRVDIGAARWTMHGAVEAGAVDVQTVAMHEAGHLLGLGHNDTVPRHIMNTAYGGVVRALTPGEGQDALDRLHAPKQRP